MQSPFPEHTRPNTSMKVSIDGGQTWINIAGTVMVALPDFDEDDTGPMDLIVTLSKTDTDMELTAERIERDDGTQRSVVSYDKSSLFDVMS